MTDVCGIPSHREMAAPVELTAGMPGFLAVGQLWQCRKMFPPPGGVPAILKNNCGGVPRGPPSSMVSSVPGCAPARVVLRVELPA